MNYRPDHEEQTLAKQTLAENPFNVQHLATNNGLHLFSQQQFQVPPPPASVFNIARLKNYPGCITPPNVFRVGQAVE